MGDTDWDVSAYERFTDLRTRPAQDLLARVFSVPPGPIIDLGCGSGANAALLKQRFPNAGLIGVDNAPDMLAKAQQSDHYQEMIEADIASFEPPSGAALIFSNAVLHWLDDHTRLIPRLFSALAVGGVLAVQMPDQLQRPSHQIMSKAAAAIVPEKFSNWKPFPGPGDLAFYADSLSDAEFDGWQTTYQQYLSRCAYGVHPVRSFVSSTGARPILNVLEEEETAAFNKLWDKGLHQAYPVDQQGGCWFPFSRQFFVARKS